MLTTAGLHVPVIPLVEVVGRTGAVVPAQNAGIALNVGAPDGDTFISMLTGAAHIPASGVNV